MPGMVFQRISLPPRLNGVSVGNVDPVVGAGRAQRFRQRDGTRIDGWVAHQGGQAGSGAFEFIRKGSGRKPGRLGHFFCPKLDLSASRLRSGLFTTGYWIWSGKHSPGA